MACPPTPAQVAVLTGLSDGSAAIRGMVREFRARRDLVVRMLRRIPGVDIVPPAGAFYAFPRFSWSLSSSEIATGLLRRGVISTPGDAFGSLGQSHLRLSFAASRENLRRGLEILEEFGASLGRARPAPVQRRVTSR
jgi:aspartate aminotransferase